MLTKEITIYYEMLCARFELRHILLDILYTLWILSVLLC
jgi:hypothetical protein